MNVILIFWLFIVFFNVFVCDFIQAYSLFYAHIFREIDGVKSERYLWTIKHT